MLEFTNDHLTKAVFEIRARMDKNKNRLIELDSVIGDGDLGLTMSKGFAAAEECARGLVDEDIGVRMKKIGFSISKAAPSTMGSLMATAFIGAGKVLSGKTVLGAGDIARMFGAMAQSVQDRGKAREGDKTVLDVLFPVARAVAAENGNDITPRMETAAKTARESLESNRHLMSQHGKAAVFREKTIGLEDPGSAAAVLLVEGFASACGVSV